MLDDDSAGDDKQAAAAHAVVLYLHALHSSLAEPTLRALRMHAALHSRYSGLQRSLHAGVGQLLQRLCCAFDSHLFASVLALHVVDVQAGAALPQRIRYTFALLVTANDQFADGGDEHEPSLLQKLIVQDVLGTYDKADMALAANSVAAAR